MRNNGQLSLNLGAGSRMRKSKADPTHVEALYFAILPDPDIASASVDMANDLRLQHGFSAKPRRPDLSHISLYRIGSYRGLPEEAAFAAMQAASTVRRRSFQVEFDRAVSFGVATIARWFSGTGTEMRS